jgi:hypothetical protein
MLFLKLFITFLTVISGLICFCEAYELIYGNELNRRNTLIIIGIILISFGLALLFHTMLKV